MAIDGCAVGRIVHFVMPSGEHRPAVIVKVWNVWNKETGLVNLQVFTDGANDKMEHGTNWETSVEYSEAKLCRTWHWPERE